jgi:cytochrome c553
MRRLRLLVIGGIGAFAAFIVLALAGVFDVASSSRHWALTGWLFDTAIRQSVTLRSMAIEVPDLDNQRLVRRAAGHYELVCAACHGSPSRTSGAFVGGLTPAPPRLMEQMEHWRPPARIFWTVKHGIKRTAMPAWPSQRRDDEVWAMVAFLLAMPDLTSEQYDALAGNTAESACGRCHGQGGADFGRAIPRLDIQTPEYIAQALAAFRDGARASGTMITAARGLSDEAIETLAARFGKTMAISGREEADTSRGKEIATRGIPERKIPACESCHGPAARPEYPRLAGQDRHYILQQLNLFVTLGPARGGPYAHMMAEAARGLTNEDMEDVAAWYER